MMWRLAGGTSENCAGPQRLTPLEVSVSQQNLKDQYSSMELQVFSFFFPDMSLA